MPGSMAWFDYIGDDAVVYAMSQDESNAVAAGNTPLTSAAQPKLPSGLKPRHILATHPASGATRSIPIGDPANAMWTGATNVISLPDYTATPVAAANFSITARIGERRTHTPHVADTGLLTG